MLPVKLTVKSLVPIEEFGHSVNSKDNNNDTVPRAAKLQGLAHLWEGPRAPLKLPFLGQLTNYKIIVMISFGFKMGCYSWKKH